MCSGRNPLNFAAWVAAFFILTAATAFADGFYITAARKVPEIQAQRALLKWKDGTETLMIASALDSESQSLGWIIPLPSVPSEIAKADPGALQTLEFCVQPRITHDLREEALRITVSVLIAILILFIWLSRPHRFFSWLGFLFILWVLTGLMMPTMGLSGSSARKSTLRVEKTAMVGSYEIAILSAKNIGDLNAWLAGNGFNSLPDAAGPAVANYIRDNWVFAAIKLTREQAGANTPHPITMTFQSREAVYPLQLTALPGSTPVFELFVLGDQRANTGLLKTEFCDSYEKGDPGNYKKHHVSSMGTKGYEFFWATNSDQAIGQSDICKLMWDGCVLTKLSGAISPAKMADDLKIRWSAYQPFQQHFYTIHGAKSGAYILFVSLFGGFVFVSLILNRKRVKLPRGLQRWLGWRVLPAAVICGAAALIFYAVVPKISVDETQLSTWPGMKGAHVVDVSNYIQNFLKDNPSIFEKSESEIAQSILAGLNEWPRNDPHKYPNRIFGGDLAIATTPGNFTVEKEGSKVLVRVYDAIGHPIVLEYDSGQLKQETNSN